MAPVQGLPPRPQLPGLPQLGMAPPGNLPPGMPANFGVTENYGSRSGPTYGAVPLTTPQPRPTMPPPTDDPSIARLDPSRTPDVSSYLTPAMQRMNELMAKRQAVPAVDPSAARPKLWERLAGVALGATQLRNPENAANVADSVVHRRLYGAERQRALALQPIDEQIKAEREAFPLYTAAGEAAWRQAQFGLENRRENREQTAFQNETGDRLFQETGPDGQTHYYQMTKSGRKLEVPAPRQIVEDQRRREEDANTPAPGAKPVQKYNSQTKQMEWLVRTKSGAMIPYQFTDVGAAALAGDPRGTALFNREHREPREPRDPNRGTPGQFAGAEVKKNQAIQKAHAAFVKATSELVPTDGKESTRRAFQQAHDDYEEATQDAQDAYEQELTSLGGVAQHSDTSQWRGSSKAQAPPAAPAPGGAEKVNELGGRKVGDVGVVRGQRVRITNIYKNGKFDYEPVTAR